jgi:beta-phosphoglucomutase
MKKIKVIIFDLDGVLVSTKNIHYECFNEALEYYNFNKISYDDHINIFDGLPTRKKIEKLIQSGNILPEYFEKIFE